MEPLNIESLVEFSAAKRIRKKLLGSSRIVIELLCYEPGQATPIHQHPQQDEVFYVLEGKGTISLGGEESPIAPQSLILVPAQVPHGMTASSDGRMVVLFFKAPGSTKAELSDQ